MERGKRKTVFKQIHNMFKREIGRQLLCPARLVQTGKQIIIDGFHLVGHKVPNLRTRVMQPGERVIEFCPVVGGECVAVIGHGSVERVHVDRRVVFDLLRCHRAAGLEKETVLQ